MRTIDEILDEIKKIEGSEKDVKIAGSLLVNPSQISMWRKRGTIPYEVLLKYSRRKNINLTWLLTGEGQRVTDREIARQLDQSGVSYSSLSEPRSKYEPDFVGQLDDGSLFIIEVKTHNKPARFDLIPLVRGPIHAGTGIKPDNIVERAVAFRDDWIRRKGDPAKMAVILISGDSMEPTLLPGDMVLVDMGRNTIDPAGGIYAIAIDDEIMIKRLQPIHPIAKVRVISDNREKYAPYDVDPDKIIINGKVIWFGRELER